MFESEGEDDDEEEDDEEEDEDEDEGDDESSSSSSEDDELTASEKVEEAERTANAALAKALGINQTGEVKLDSDDDDMLDDDEESMDDEQMLALDDQLAIIFRERQKALTANGTVATRKIKQDAKFNMITFKARAIDLLEIFIKAQPESPLILTAVIPLINVIKTSNDKQLADKAHLLLKSRLCKIKTLPVLTSTAAKTFSEEEGAEFEESDPTGPVTADDLINWLVSIHTMVRKSNRVQLSLACNQASVFLSKVLITNDMTHAEHVVTIYSQTLNDWLVRSNAKTQPALFFEFINWVNSARGPLHKAAKKMAGQGEDSGKKDQDEDQEMED